jgi:hypothetical protein
LLGNLFSTEIELISCSISTVSSSLFNTSVSSWIARSCVPWVIFRVSLVQSCCVLRWSASNVLLITSIWVNILVLLYWVVICNWSNILRSLTNKFSIQIASTINLFRFEAFILFWLIQIS